VKLDETVLECLNVEGMKPIEALSAAPPRQDRLLPLPGILRILHEFSTWVQQKKPACPKFVGQAGFFVVKNLSSNPEGFPSAPTRLGCNR
jgi:hypothetical protein